MNRCEVFEDFEDGRQRMIVQTFDNDSFLHCTNHIRNNETNENNDIL